MKGAFWHVDTQANGKMAVARLINGKKQPKIQTREGEWEIYNSIFVVAFDYEFFCVALELVN